MRRRLVLIACALSACWRGGSTTPDSSTSSLPVGRWIAIDDDAPASRELPHSEEAAPGRNDDAGGIHGFCPPKLVVFRIDRETSLAFGEPCSGPTTVVLRHGGSEEKLWNNLYGAGGTWHAFPLPGHQALVVHEGGSTLLYVVSVASRQIIRFDLPRALMAARRLVVSVDRDRVYLSGGVLLEGRGSYGCEGPRPPNQGCDPVAMTAEVTNDRTFVLRVPDDPGALPR
jgi:hypothetical protein